MMKSFCVFLLLALASSSLLTDATSVAELRKQRKMADRNDGHFGGDNGVDYTNMNSTAVGTPRSNSGSSSGDGDGSSGDGDRSSDGDDISGDGRSGDGSSDDIGSASQDQTDTFYTASTLAQQQKAPSPRAKAGIAVGVVVAVALLLSVAVFSFPCKDCNSKKGAAPVPTKNGGGLEEGTVTSEVV